ncbi:protein phosphatase 1 regulatory subunit 14D isoform X1 [Octodon degus]|uniref:Protein phosphatase 1 regulatory subunit 14 n=1 Tax=Octodon degus TaxID=10160 RepID=A0A6P6E8P4_OCTDE|nr:protein phosphatase 1 regulatory subunit 14D isoform X1 [Octodon degus]
MLSPRPRSCTSPNPDRENPSKKVQWASEGRRRRTSSTDSESKSHTDPCRLARSRRPSRLTVKYDWGQLQRWLEMEQWVDAQVQELFQDQAEPSELEIDLEALMELSTEEQRTQLEVGWEIGHGACFRLRATQEPRLLPPWVGCGWLSRGLWEGTVSWASTLISFTQGILQNCSRPTEPFISELLSQLKKLRRLSRPQK